MSRIEDLLAAARARIRRLSPDEALAAVQHGALLVDTRPQWQRAAEGEFPDWENVVVIERNQLEWRLDPTSDAHITPATSPDLEVVVACSEGYSSSLAAASLVDVGLHRSADLAGGFQAWRSAGLPIREAAGHPQG